MGKLFLLRDKDEKKIERSFEVTWVSITRVTSLNYNICYTNWMKLKIISVLDIKFIKVLSKHHTRTNRSKASFPT